MTTAKPVRLRRTQPRALGSIHLVGVGCADGGQAGSCQPCHDVLAEDLTDDEVSTLYKWAALYRANVVWRQPPGSGVRSDWQLEISMSDPTSDAAELLSAALADVALMHKLTINARDVG